MSTTHLTDKINAALAQNRKAVMPYLPAGYPDKDSFWQHIRDLDASGADIIEIGVPFSDPIADGPVVEQAGLCCLEQGVSLEWILDELGKRRTTINAGIVLMGYMNPFLQYGISRLAKQAAACGVNGLIIADLPLEESAEIRRVFQGQDIDLIPLVGLNSTPQRLRMHAEQATGFVYFVSVMGTTGMRDALPEELQAALTQAKEIFTIPLALGFGLHSPIQLKGVESVVDGVVMGSSLIRHIDEQGKVGSFLDPWSR
jgi:tryptophan synthase alpha chain